LYVKKGSLLALYYAGQYYANHKKTSLSNTPRKINYDPLLGYKMTKSLPGQV